MVQSWIITFIWYYTWIYSFFFLHLLRRNTHYCWHCDRIVSESHFVLFFHFKRACARQHVSDNDAFQRQPRTTRSKTAISHSHLPPSSLQLLTISCHPTPHPPQKEEKKKEERNCSGLSQIPLFADPSNYCARLRAVQQPHRTSLCSNYVYTGTRSRRWGIWVILFVRSAARLKIPQNQTLIELCVCARDGCVRLCVHLGGTRLTSMTLLPLHLCNMKSYSAHGPIIYSSAHSEEKKIHWILWGTWRGKLFHEVLDLQHATKL